MALGRQNPFSSLSSWSSTAGLPNMSHPLAQGLLFAWCADRGFDADVGPYGRLHGAASFTVGPHGLAVDCTTVDTGFVARFGSGTVYQSALPLTIGVVMVQVGVPSSQYKGIAGVLHNLTDSYPWTVLSLGVGSGYNFTIDGNSGGTSYQYEQTSAPWSAVYSAPSVSVVCTTTTAIRGWRDNTQHVAQSVSSSNPTYGSPAAFYVGFEEGWSGVHPNARIAAVCVWNRELSGDEFYGFVHHPLTLWGE